MCGIGVSVLGGLGPALDETLGHSQSQAVLLSCCCLLPPGLWLKASKSYLPFIGF